MEKQLLVGTNNFRKLVSHDGLTADKTKMLFIDKSLFIREFLKNYAEVLLITRPRRWGKTLALSILHHFFSAELDGQPTGGLWKNLAINQFLENDPELAKYQGQTPSIYISFKDLKGETADEIEADCAEKISQLFKDYKYLISKQSQIDSFDNKKFLAILEKSASKSELGTSLEFLSKLLHKHHGKKVMVLIDEYDNIINKKFDQPQLLGRLTEFFSVLFGSCLKDNSSLDRGLVTGILRLAKANIFSGLNNLVERTILDDHFVDFYGFDETEVKQILSEAGMEYKPEVKEWFNGYLVGNTLRYNPWSITQYIAGKGKLQPYWVDTAKPTMMKNLLINKSESKNRLKIGKLLEEGQLNLDYPLEKHISMEDVLVNSESLWSLLLHTGYLTLVEQGNNRLVRLPNFEVKSMVQKYINAWFVENPLLSDATNALLFGNVQKFVEVLANAISDPVYNARIFNNRSSIASGDLREFMYQFLVMHMLKSDQTNPDYEVLAEPEQISLRRTRPDFTILNHKDKICVVGEIKVPRKKEDLLRFAQEVAISQINKNQYGATYQNQGYHLVKLGLAFHGLDFEVGCEGAELE